MRIGSLRKRLTLQSAGLLPDGSGTVWTTLVTVWGEMIPVSGNAAVVAGVSDRRITHTIRLRWPPDVTVETGMRLLLGPRAFTIRSVVNREEANRWLEVMVEEGGAL